MSSFDDREKGFERKYIHDQDTAFKVNARRNKLLGLWAAGKLGKQGAQAEQYAKEVAMADVEGANHQGVTAKLGKDFAQAGIAVNLKEIHAEMERLLPVAREQIGGQS